MTKLSTEERQKQNSIIYRKKQHLKNIDAATYSQGTIFSDILGLLIFLSVAYFFISSVYYSARLLGIIIFLVSFYWVACIAYKISK
jgi:hypothetical protein